MDILLVRYSQRAIWLMVFLFCSCYVQANSDLPDEVNKKSIDCSADVFKDGYETDLNELREMNIQYSIKLCKQLLVLKEQDVTEEVNAILIDLSMSNRSSISKFFSGDKILEDKISSMFDDFTDVAIEGPIETKKLGELKVMSSLDDGSNTDFYFNTISNNYITFTSADDGKCMQIDGRQYDSCKKALEDIKNAFNAYREHYTNTVTKVNGRLLDNMSRNWERFLDNARSQTLLDIWATTLINSGHYKKDHLVSPAEVQYFLAHPGIIYEHVGDAPSGEKDKVSLSMEWVGFNFWNQTVPWGVSWVTTYADRRDVSSVGQGIMIYLDNKYSFGWTRRDQGNGYFISLDVLKLFSDKTQQFDQYKSMF